MRFKVSSSKVFFLDIWRDTFGVCIPSLFFVKKVVLLIGGQRKYTFFSDGQTPANHRSFSGRCEKCWVSTFRFWYSRNQ